ncbi:NAD(P)/FAD-dependent oxidoreductase [Paenibacillus soyae]|uniref:NAD(P)/FAD-dependent oxidoreductase n=1 Tax=Paenibacillus soyae TaxID=2969249 RepID=A0A9X2MNE5_9BACL|nr:NAD(P)/FAD-dependent oxidoreductase [Paenibacillus soyae]MCR2805138.1 NAD(P)/FAD-dependent oxidoreductase [Paenibacillus soyae]
MRMECAIIGGGPAGLNAALVLGRARRQVALFDDNQPRNAVTKHTHGFMTRDGAKPEELRSLARQDIKKYPTVRTIAKRITGVMPILGGFRLQAGDGSLYECRKLLLATGLSETLPDIHGIRQYYGRSLFNCPYCDGWELRDQPLVVIAEGSNAFSLTRLAYQWSRNLLVCTNGSMRALTGEELQLLQRKGVAVSHDRIKELAGSEGMLRAVAFENGGSSKRTGGFVSPYWRHASPLGELLGCRMNESGGIETDALGRTSVYGVYAAGDASVIAPAQAVIAAGEGSRAAIGMNSDLAREDFA